MNDRNPRSIRTSSKSTSDTASGVLETIASGLSLVLARPYLIVVPLLLDLILWLGVQISISPLTTPLARLMRSDGGANGEDAADQLLKLGDQLHLNDTIGAFVPSIFAGLPKDTALNWLVTFLAPPISGGVDRDVIVNDWGSGLFSAWTPPHWFAVLSLGALFLVVSSIVMALFRVPLARAVRGQRGSLAESVREIAISWARMIALFLLAGAIIMGIFIPVVLSAAVLLIFGVNIAVLVALGLFVLGGMASIYTFFTLDAMLLRGLGPINSIRASFRVVRGNFGECSRFALACVLIQTGLLRVWHILVENPPGFVIALVANAFIGAGIAAATMIFFSERYSRMELAQGSPRPPSSGPGRTS